MLATTPDHPPAPGPPPEAQEGKRPWLKWVLIGCLGVIILAVLCFALLFGIVMKATAGPEKAVKAFLDEAGKGNYAAAYEHFSAQLKQSQSLDEFTAMAENNARLFKVKDTTFTNRSVDMNGAEFSGSVTLESGEKMPASFKLIRQNGHWRLIAYHIGPP